MFHVSVAQIAISKLAFVDWASLTSRTSRLALAASCDVCHVSRATCHVPARSTLEDNQLLDDRGHLCNQLHPSRTGANHSHRLVVPVKQ